MFFHFALTQKTHGQGNEPNSLVTLNFPVRLYKECSSSF
ncbi:hypothetical protein PHOSAC3_90085 [Mesotoga infera]|nr:hypothetical protein PHOSAC3_90085 [Mesotoga infera]